METQQQKPKIPTGHGETGQGNTMPGSNGNGQTAAPAHGDEHSIPGNLPRPSSISIIAMMIAFVVLLAAMFAIGYFPHRATEEQTQADANAHSSAVPSVTVAHPQLAAAATDLQLPCQVMPWQQTDIYPQATGYLKELKVDIQDRVKKGDLLAVIDTPTVDAQLDQSKAALQQDIAAVATAQANLVYADQTLKRYDQANKEDPGSITQTDYDSKKAAYDQAVAALDQAKANVKAGEAAVQQLTVQQGFEKVIAPFDGIVTVRNFDIGAYLNAANFGPGKQLFSMVQSDTLRVFVNVPQVYVTGIKTGQDAQTGQDAYLEVTNYPNRKFKGVVARKADALDPATRTMSFELNFPNAEGALYAGMYGTAVMSVTDNHPVLRVPSSALVFNATGTHVAVVRNGKVHFTQITVGRDYGTLLEIPTGLTADDEVITNPGEQITEGGTVQIGLNLDASQPAAEPRKPLAQAGN